MDLRLHENTSNSQETVKIHILDRKTIKICFKKQRLLRSALSKDQQQFGGQDHFQVIRKKDRAHKQLVL